MANISLPRDNNRVPTMGAVSNADGVTPVALWADPITHRLLVDDSASDIVVPTVDNTASGPTTTSFNSGYTSTTIGDLVYLDSSSTWQKCDANTLLLYNGMLGIAITVAASGAALTVALPGSYIYASVAFPTFTIGLPVYMSETPAAVTQTKPTTSAAAVRVIGWGIHADKLYFFPSPDYITNV